MAGGAGLAVAMLQHLGAGAVGRPFHLRGGGRRARAVSSFVAFRTAHCRGAATNRLLVGGGGGGGGAPTVFDRSFSVSGANMPASPFGRGSVIPSGNWGRDGCCIGGGVGLASPSTRRGIPTAASWSSSGLACGR